LVVQNILNGGGRNVQLPRLCHNGCANEALGRGITFLRKKVSGKQWTGHSQGDEHEKQTHRGFLKKMLRCPNSEDRKTFLKVVESYQRVIQVFSEISLA
jgi:hypothetical protein